MAASLVIAAAGCGSSSSNTSTKGVPNGAAKAPSAKFAGAAASPQKPVPPLVLSDSVGQKVNVDQFRGKAILVTFIYTHCPDICPLIVGHLHTAQAQLGPEARKLQIIAVSTDPRGDTPKTVAKFLKEHQMTGRMKYLIGSQKQLGSVWSGLEHHRQAGAVPGATRSSTRR